MENVMRIVENENAQFMLLAGFIIAIGLVIATALLSNIIFESNMAGEAGIDPLKYDIANLMRIAGDETKSAYRNANGTNNSLKIDNFSRQMQNFSVNLPKMFALRGEGVTVSWDVSNWNNSRYPNFTDNGMPGGATSWTVIENVKNSTIKVNASTPGSFSVNVSSRSNLSNFWLINPGSSFSTSITNITPPYSIIFINGASASGNYSITGNTNDGRAFTRARDYILNATVSLSTSRMRANFTIPVSVPW